MHCYVVRNLAYSQPMSPPLVVAHTRVSSSSKLLVECPKSNSACGSLNKEKN